jgi:hypothetical protein
MKTFNHIGSMLAGAAMITTVVGLTAGLAPSAAAPKRDGATLDIVQDSSNNGNYVLVVNGAYPMEQPDAQGYINNINTGSCGERGYSGLTYSILGDDGNRQNIAVRQYPGQGHLSATPRGLEYSRAIPIQKGFLDEDRGGDVDEIYVEVYFVDADCGHRTQYTQVVSRRF